MKLKHLHLHALRRLLPLSALLGGLLMLVMPASAQDTQLVTLNDATPSLALAVDLPADTSGVVSLNISQAMVNMRNQAGELVFRAADPRLHTVEFSIAPNTGSHTILIERLPGYSQAYVSVVALPQLSATDPASVSVQPQVIDNNLLMLNQERALPLSPSAPGGNVTISIPNDTTGLITTTFPGVSMQAQIVDQSGTVMAASVSDVDGYNFVVDGGEYRMNFLSNNLTTDHTVGVRVMSASANGFAMLEPPSNIVLADTQAQTVADCTATVLPGSVNLRSGPGTGYSVLAYGYQNQTFPVGGINTQQNWVLIGAANGSNTTSAANFSGWVSRDLTELNGACDRLTIYDIPLRQAKPAQIIIQTQPQAPTVDSSGGGSGGSSGGEEHEDGGEKDDD